MAITRQQKEAQVQDLAQKMKNASSVIFAQYQGLSVSDITKLRGKLKKDKAVMQVSKKTLIQIAAKEAGMPEISDDVISGAVACVFSQGEPTSGPNIVHSFGKDHPHVKILGGIFSGKALSVSEANALATIPSRLQLLATFVGMCSSPLVSFASAISSPLSSFARGVSELAKKKEASAGAPPAPVAEAPAPSPAA